MLAINRQFLSTSRRWDGQTVGLYGGSFNPAHGGHIHVSHRALKHLKLDALWWLVSPVNPLKQARDVAQLDARVKHAQSLVQHPKIHVTALEQDLQTRYSAHTIARLKARHPKTQFIWIMGADNLATFHHWQGWQSIFDMLPIAVIDRPGYSLNALSSPAARKFRRDRLSERRSTRLKGLKPPAWVFLHGPLHTASATAIRAQQPEWIVKADGAKIKNGL